MESGYVPHCSKCKTTDEPLLNQTVRFKRGAKVGHYQICRTCQNQRMRRYSSTEKGRRRIIEGNKKSAKRNWHKQLARLKVRNALKVGKLVRTKCQCGEVNVQAHHTDYSKPLDVVWLCVGCHANEHRKLLSTAAHATGDVAAPQAI